MSNVILRKKDLENLATEVLFFLFKSGSAVLQIKIVKDPHELMTDFTQQPCLRCHFVFLIFG